MTDYEKIASYKNIELKATVVRASQECLILNLAVVQLLNMNFPDEIFCLIMTHCSTIRQYNTDA